MCFCCCTVILAVPYEIQRSNKKWVAEKMDTGKLWVTSLHTPSSYVTFFSLFSWTSLPNFLSDLHFKWPLVLFQDLLDSNYSEHVIKTLRGYTEGVLVTQSFVINILCGWQISILLHHISWCHQPLATISFFPKWMTSGTCYVLFSVGTIIKDSHHRKSPTRPEQAKAWEENLGFVV